MINLNEFLKESFNKESFNKEELNKEEFQEELNIIDESKEDEVYAIVDETGAIQVFFNTKEEADEEIKKFPKVAYAKIKKMKKSEIEI